MPSSAVRDVLADAQKLAVGYLGLLADLVAVNSHANNRAGIDRCLALLEPALRELGFSVDRATGTASIDGQTVERDHLRARRGAGAAPGTADGAPTILLLGHVDTVFEPGDPFALSRGDDVWRGPGVIDMKGGLVTALLSVELCRRLGILDRAHWRVLFVTDEEQGSPTGASALDREATGVDLALCFEAARPCGGLVVARKGLGEFHVEVRGTRGHAGIDHGTAVNAFSALCEFVVAAEAVESAVPGVTVSPGGRVACSPPGLGSVSDRAACELEWRFAEDETGRAAERELRLRARDIERRTGAAIELRGGLAHPAMPETALVASTLASYRRAAAQLGFEVDGVSTAGVGDINLVAARGVACLDGVGPRGSGFHTTDEQLEIVSIPERAAMNALALADYLGSP